MPRSSGRLARLVIIIDNARRYGDVLLVGTQVDTRPSSAPLEVTEEGAHLHVRQEALNHQREPNLLSCIHYGPLLYFFSDVLACLLYHVWCCCRDDLHIAVAGFCSPLPCRHRVSPGAGACRGLRQPTDEATQPGALVMPSALNLQSIRCATRHGQAASSACSHVVVPGRRLRCLQGGSQLVQLAQPSAVVVARLGRRSW